jgi:hypothetical protein
MKNYATISFAIIILALATATNAKAGCGVAPANDNLAAAIPLVLSGGTTSVTTNNICATKEVGEPNHAEDIGGSSVWFKFTPTVTKVIRINTTDTTFDTLLAVYAGNAVNDLQIVGHNNDGKTIPGFDGASTADLMLTAGTTYYIAVDGLNTSGVTEQGNFKIALLEYDAPDQDNFNSAYDLGYSFRGSIAGTNYNATIEPGEPDAMNANPNGKSVWYKWKSSDSIAMSFEVTDNFRSQIGIYTSVSGSPTINDIFKVAAGVDYTGFTGDRYKATFFAEANRTYYIKIDWHNIGGSESVGNFQMKFNLNRLPYSANFAIHHRTALAVFRPSEGAWYRINNINTPLPGMRLWGKSGDVPIAADFRGVGYSQLAAIRNENDKKIWYIATPEGVPYETIHWGIPSDKAVVGDFDRDGRADPTIIRNSANGYLWYVRRSRDDSMRIFNFGTTGDKPVLGDFDGDGLTEVSVVRNTQNGLMWYQIRSGFESGPNYSQTVAFQFGTTPDIPAVADFDGDGKTDVSVFRPSTGTWYIIRSGSGQLQITPFGASGDRPQPADYDGDGKADLALFRPSDGNWYFWMSGTNTQRVFHWGTPGDIPVSSLATLSQ